MAFANDTKHNFSGGELSPKLRGRNDLEIYFSSVDRMENFIPGIEGEATLRTGTAYSYTIDTAGGYDERDLATDLDVKTATINVNNTGDAESALVHLYKHWDSGTKTVSLDVHSRPSTRETVELKYTSYGSRPFWTLKAMDMAQIGTDLIITHPKYYGVNRLYWNGANWITRAAEGVVNVNSDCIHGWPFFGDSREPKPAGVSLFESRMVILSTKPGTLHFSRAMSPDTGLNRYLDFLGQTITMSVYDSFGHGSTGNYQVLGPVTWRDWKISADTDFKVYIENIATGERTLKTKGTAAQVALGQDVYYVVVTVGLPDPLAENIEVRFGVHPTTDYRVVLVRNVGYADDAFTINMQLTTIQDKLLWAAPLRTFLAVGTTNGIYSISSSDGTGLSATNLKIEAISYSGSADMKPVIYKDGFIYVDNTKRNFKYLRYDFFNGGYRSISLGPTQQNILTSDISSIAFYPNDPDCIFITTADYKSQVFTLSPAGEITGYFKTPTNAFSGPTSVCGFYDIYTKANRLLMLYQTTTKLIIGEQSEIVRFKDASDFYTGDKDADTTAYLAYLQDTIKTIYLLDTYSTATNQNHIDLPAVFEGFELAVIADGEYLGDYTVASNKIELDTTYELIVVGFKYRGLLRSNAITGGGTNGEAGAKEKSIVEIAILFSNTLGVEMGLDPYDLEAITFADASELYAGEQPAMFSGVKRLLCSDNWNYNKHLYIVQNKPFPCTIQRIDLFGDTTNE